MNGHQWLSEQFEANRPHLRAVAYRVLASSSEADDAVQEAWLRLSRSDTREVENLRAWLTTVVARVSLDMLRSRQTRREEPLQTKLSEQIISRESGSDPEREFLLAESVGLALLVVLDRLSPSERLAFVLHDMFALPFNEIASIIECSSTAARQLASRARRRVQGAAVVPDADFARRQEVVEAFLAASRGGDFDALLGVLDPDVVLRADAVVMPPHGVEVRGARHVAGRALGSSKRARFAQLALVDGEAAIIVAPYGRLFMVLGLTVARGKVVEIDIIADSARLNQLDIAVLHD